MAIFLNRLSSKTLFFPVQYFSVGRVPLDPRLASCLETGLNFSETHRDTSASTALSDLVQSLIERTDPQ